MPKRASTYQVESEEVEPEGLDPLIEALLSHLPAPGKVFTPEQRRLWMQVFELCLQLIYRDKEETNATG